MEQRADARLVIADDHQLFAEACRSILEPKYKVVSIVTDSRELLKAASTFRPDLIILDIAMPNLKWPRCETTDQAQIACHQTDLSDHDPKS